MFISIVPSNERRAHNRDTPSQHRDKSIAVSDRVSVVTQANAPLHVTTPGHVMNDIVFNYDEQAKY